MKSTRARKAPAPVPPRNVRAVMPDGATIPVECAYIGTNEVGQHIWEAVWTLPTMPAQLLVAVIPAKTTVRLRYQV